MIFVLYTIHVLICLFLIMVVLLQQGSGADLSVFGGGGTQTVFGARSATNLLHRLTVAAFIGFIATTIAIGLYRLGSEQDGVMSNVDTDQATTAEEALPAADVDTLDETTDGLASESAVPDAAGTDGEITEPAAGQETTDDAGNATDADGAGEGGENTGEGNTAGS